MAVTDLARIEDRLDKITAGAVEVSAAVGGMKIGEMIQVMETAKLLSMSGPAIPKWLQGNVGGCWAVMIQALEWGLSPISVARMSFDVNGVVGYMSQLVHAVVEKRAPLKTRLRCAYEGDGDARVCIVTGHFKNEPDAVVYRSPQLSKINPKNSPLWKTDPDQQLWFYSSRAWARRYCPDVLLGIYSEDELRDSGIGPDNAKDITPKPDIASRLAGPKDKRGFSAAHVEKHTAAESKPAVPPHDPETGEILDAECEDAGTDVLNTEAADDSEPPLARGTRLLASCTTKREVEDLRATIADEIEPADGPAWLAACASRETELKKGKGAL